MFDGDNIAKQALHRAEELKVEKNRRRTMRGMVSLIGSCTAFLVIALLIFPFGNLSDDGIFIGDDQVPLAEFTIPQADENAKPYTSSEQAEQSIKIPDIGKTIIAANGDEMAMLLLNPAGNAYDFIFEIILAKTGETIFKSGLVSRGMCIENPILSRTLAKGEYSAVLRIFFVSENSLSDSVDINFKLLTE